MSRRSAVFLGLAAFAMAAPAMAADPTYYPPPAGAPFYAPSPIAFHAELGLGALLGSSTSGVFEGAFRGAVPVYGALHAEVEGNAMSTFGGSNTTGQLVAGTFIHLFHKTPQAALGGFVGVSSFAPFSAGLEANWYWGQWLWTGQIAHHWTPNSTNNITQLRGGAYYYMTPNHKVGGYINYATNPQRSATEIGLAGEKLFDGTPLSVYGRLAYLTSTGTNSGNGFLALIGGRWFFGTQTLLEADQAVPFNVRLPLSVGTQF